MERQIPPEAFACAQPRDIPVVGRQSEAARLYIAAEGRHVDCYCTAALLGAMLADLPTPPICLKASATGPASVILRGADAPIPVAAEG